MQRLGALGTHQLQEQMARERMLGVPSPNNGFPGGSAAAAAQSALLLDQHRQINALQEAERMRQAGQIPGLGLGPGGASALSDPALISRLRHEGSHLQAEQLLR